MEERLERLEAEVREVRTGLEDVREGLGEVRIELAVLSDRMHGLEERMGATNVRLDVGVESLRGDFRVAFDRIDGLREHMERSRGEDRRERTADRDVLLSLVRDHNRRIRAIERLESRRKLP